MATLDVRGPLTRDVIALEGSRLTLGASPRADIVIEGDPTVSKLHLVLELIGSTWFVRDLGARNGTFLNGEAVLGERPLRPGDEVMVGRTTLTFRDPASVRDRTTETAKPPPELTPGERKVLNELCRPMVAGTVFTAPATVREIAAALVVGQPAVKQHLANLYTKFGIPPDGTQNRRVLLANEALSRGAVRTSDLLKSRAD
ncbi:MAG TPA: FHA domain-containing protein [Actinomycetes bacterium]|nr:FHA domain-containing protein [Actinomycetes bacterium]